MDATNARMLFGRPALREVGIRAFVAFKALQVFGILIYEQDNEFHFFIIRAAQLI